MNPKEIAAQQAVQFIEEGMIVGLGTGSTAYWAIQQIGQRVQAGLHIRAVASSQSSEDLARQAGIPMVEFSEITSIDLTIDGADEVDDQLNLIKGGGGALLREKIIAFHSKRFIVIVDESKRVQHLGRFSLPVEIVPFASNLTINRLTELDCKPQLRLDNGKEFVTDNGNWIVDCKFEKILLPQELGTQIHSIPGVVEHGLFVQMASSVVVGYKDGSTKILSN
ncbi:ribose-5-phosphate isomerase RpiA [Paenibacillus sp. FSL H7-0331]|uniref:ribose-5-phosphate isomerase RpiA n=1 Tax=Paenibacillus sp. FSL H7-0331 TaxID=1920421 RepID=UPI00096F32C4|nr:ribose-5-phosphate isomerase RpiA [Paenibacillus sp. FSL H7-0331]OMF08956.1 ribose 5-phosphate isomerase A [Paenibacillus sp. FSL H7-0331]